MSKDQELIWVDKVFAAEYKKLSDDASQREEQLRVLNEYMEGVQASSRDEFRAHLDSLTEDVAIYTGLMTSVKQAFEKAKNEQLAASYAIWEQFDKELPSISEKTTQIIDCLNPLVEKLTTINELLGKIQTYDFDRLIKTIEHITELYGKNKDMVQFLVNHYAETKT